ncbi:NADH-quinone oxidoreductase subunit M [Pyrococcus furiosus DSM 3638]|uniref:NADH-quinone oxidoreductase subunit M n=3 Tax=Pyrococcus furiosus TaxID=2261 RepID=A0A5C0XRA1_PYRFU|nr:MULTISPECIES: proton-conducting transporter membrane subunit [Pyrococcus]6U8Y_X Chain X, NADH dehydrogenase subunit M [Pyrococcus furiosus COM1]6U8Y_x Chain x, NADH dehydrogenase subunit M [Pyrococcus furiosus COM1]AAL81570.1 NADH dehydrogenase subunit [Pyrococcus furiosus DSM 3638]AFN04229.1 NADH dehydrogenase subunit M [Pyrococcus furiosus COM1]MDK2869507.1 NADH-quinone oxidoreductase subunit [Pyrococcus sp.]QEK79075.1 NADH-quinone oxidoreductase subunit M [Pyrococcus furiosus DSM 3638]
MNELPIILLSPLIGGALAWLIRVKGIREAIGVVSSAIPLYFLIKLYPALEGEPIRYSLNVGGFELTLALSHISWIFAMIAAVVGLSAVLGLVSTAKDSNEWLFALMSLAGALGVFLANDFVVFFLSWEIMTFASFMMVFKYNRHASLKYFVLSIAGAYAMLLAIGIIYAKTGSLSFPEISAIFRQDAMMGMMGGGGVFTKTETLLIYALFLVAFGVKAGMFPLHVWAPDAYSETNQSYTAMFSGVLSKTGVYGFFLLYLLMYGKLAITLGNVRSAPTFGYIIAFLGGLTIMVGGILAALQEDIRKLFAYSSISQIGYILIGLGIGTPLGIAAATYHAISHALFKGLFFLIVATIIYRTGKTEFKDYGGLAEKMPITFAMAFVAILSLAGIPPMAGFASKWLIFEAVISRNLPILGAMVFFGSAIGFVYLIRFTYAVWFGQRPSDLEDVKDAPLPLAIGMGILAILNVIFGVAPGLVARELNKLFSNPPIGGTIWELDLGFGRYNGLLLSIWLVIGLIIAAILYFMGAGVRKVPVTDTYQSGNPVTMEYNLTIRRNFFLPLKEAMAFWLKMSFDRLYHDIWKAIEELADLARSYVYNGNIQAYAWYLAIILLILVAMGV